MFTLKKILSALLYPLPMAFLVTLLSLIFIRQGYKKTATTLLSLSLIGLYLVSIPPISDYATGLLEKPYPLMVQLPPHLNRIVVLGSGSRGHLPVISQQLDNASLNRAIEGIRLTKIGLAHHQPMLLILSGGGLKPPYSAPAMQALAIEMGIPKANTLVESQSLDTYDEAVILKPILQQQAFALVTSGVHMTRAMALFSHLGMHPVAAPTQIQHMTQYTVTLNNFIPRANALAAFDSAWHEFGGLIWSYLRHQI